MSHRIKFGFRVCDALYLLVQIKSRARASRWFCCVAPSQNSSFHKRSSDLIVFFYHMAHLRGNLSFCEFIRDFSVRFSAQFTQGKGSKIYVTNWHPAWGFPGLELCAIFLIQFVLVKCKISQHNGYCTHLD